MKVHGFLSALARASEIAVCLCVLFASCAQVHVRKVTSKNDAKLEGFRYYLPRPFVVVKKEFPVVGDDYLVSGLVNDKGDLVELEGELKPELKGMFPTGIPANAIVLPAANPSRAAVTGGSQAATDNKAGGKDDAVKPPARFDVDADGKMLAGSKAEPNIVVASTTLVTVTVKVAKDAPLEVGPALEKIVLIPLKDDKPDTAKMLQFDAVPQPKKEKDKEGIYIAAIDPAKLAVGTSYSLGIRMTAKQTSMPAEPEALDRVFHRTAVDINVQGKAPPAKDEPAKDPAKDTTVMSKADVTTSGDPLTDPFVKLGNDVFDVLYLPDLDEQYAVSTSAGLGQINSQIGMENGWMVERANVQIDNREIGKFIFDKVDKVFDLATSLVAPGAAQASAAGDLAAKAKTPGAQAATDSPERKDARRVVLRVKYVRFATPGIYPILKRSEKPCCDVAPSYVLLPYRPFTVIAFNTRQQIQVELVSLKSDTPPDMNAVRAAIKNAFSDKKKFTFNEVVFSIETVEIKGTDKFQLACTLDTVGDKTKPIAQKALEQSVHDFVLKQIAGLEKYVSLVTIANYSEVAAKFKSGSP